MGKRIPQLEKSQLNDEQQAIYDAIVASRGSIHGPFRIWLHSPALADRAQKLGAFLRYDSSLDSRLTELAILVTARAWDCQVEWSLHETLALKAGVDPKVIEAVRTNQFPRFDKDDEQVVYEFTTELIYNRFVQDRTYAAAVDDLGGAGAVELTALIGYYGLVAMTLNTFQVPIPEEIKPRLVDCPVFR